MKNPLKFWLGTLTVFLLALTPSVVPVGGSVALASAATVSEDGGTVCAQTVDNSGGVTVTKPAIGGSDYCVITFARVGTTSWTVPLGISSVDFLIIGGGGAGGGAAEGGGGGAGGFIERSGISASGTLQVVVGRGGQRQYPPTRATGEDGGDSSFLSRTANGGGGGGANFNQASAAGNPGGSGGGGGGWGSGSGSTSAGGLGNVRGYDPREGNNGGAGDDNNGGGGGGAGGPGKNSGDDNGNGGPGRASSITGASVIYAGGGGGASYGIDGTGGSGGGGDASEDGVDGLGGGGGGADAPGRSGNGGSGVVIVRYLLEPPDPVSGLELSAERFVDAGSDADSVTLQWTAAAAQTPSVTGYEVKYSTNADMSSPSTVSVSGASTTSREITGLTDGATYYFEIFAKNANDQLSTTAPRIVSRALSAEDYALDTQGDAFASGDAVEVIPTASGSDFTVEMWVKLESLAGGSIILSQGDGADT